MDAVNCEAPSPVIDRLKAGVLHHSIVVETVVFSVFISAVPASKVFLAGSLTSINSETLIFLK